jgi:hypothetical protein
MDEPFPLDLCLPDLRPLNIPRIIRARTVDRK